MINSFNLTLSGKYFICPSLLKDSFAGYSNLVCRFLPFMTWNTCFQLLLACKDSFEKSADSLMGTPLQVTVSFSLAAFKIISFCLILVNVIMMCLHVCFLGSNLSGDSLSFLDFLEVYFLCQIREVLLHYLFELVFDFLLFFSFWHPYELDVITLSCP